MPIDYDSILETIQQELINYYAHNPHPRGNWKSTQFEKAVERIAKRVFAEYDRTHGLPEHYHVVEYLGGNIFPDIIVRIGTTNEKVGIEVKYHDSSDDWKTKGNSTYAKTQVDGLTEIYVVFGKFDHGTCDIKARPYGDCISGISVTHNPRYDINMKATSDFCVSELGIPYDTLRRYLPEQRKIYINTYIAKTKYATFSNVEPERREKLITEAFILFPEMFAKNPKIRYNNFSVWLFANNVICKNVRDFLTAGGQDTIDGTTFPKVFITLYNHIDQIKRTIGILPPQVLARAWYGDVTAASRIPVATADLLNCWLSLATDYHGGDTSIIKDTTLNFKDTLQTWFGI